jgi:hypothetical protein
MTDRTGPESIEERNLRILVAGACLPDAPALPSGLPARLAARARNGAAARIDPPLVAAACSAGGLILLAFTLFLPAGRTDLRAWTLLLPAANLLLAPFAAYVVVRNFKGGLAHDKT